MSIEKIKRIAQEKYGKALTDEQASMYAEKYGKISDSELDDVSGGCDGNHIVLCPQCESGNTSLRGSHGQAFGFGCHDCGFQW